jgi:hypothetical protein
VEDRTCWWCKKRPPDKLAQFEMHADVKSSSTYAGTKRTTTTTWRSLKVPIPVCRQCAQAHEDASRTWRSWKIVCGVGFALLLIASFVLANNYILNIYVGLTITAVWGLGCWAIGQHLARQKLAQSGTERFRTGRTYPAVIEKQKEGWAPAIPAKAF